MKEYTLFDSGRSRCRTSTITVGKNGIQHSKMDFVSQNNDVEFQFNASHSSNYWRPRDFESCLEEKCDMWGNGVDGPSFESSSYYSSDHMDIPFANAVSDPLGAQQLHQVVNIYQPSAHILRNTGYNHVVDNAIKPPPGLGGFQRQENPKVNVERNRYNIHLPSPGSKVYNSNYCEPASLRSPGYSLFHHDLATRSMNKNLCAPMEPLAGSRQEPLIASRQEPLIASRQAHQPNAWDKGLQINVDRFVATNGEAKDNLQSLANNIVGCNMGGNDPNRNTMHVQRNNGNSLEQLTMADVKEHTLASIKRNHSHGLHHLNKLESESDDNFKKRKNERAIMFLAAHLVTKMQNSRISEVERHTIYQTSVNTLEDDTKVSNLVPGTPVLMRMDRGKEFVTIKAILGFAPGNLEESKTPFRKIFRPLSNQEHMEYVLDKKAVQARALQTAIRAVNKNSNASQAYFNPVPQIAVEVQMDKASMYMYTSNTDRFPTNQFNVFRANLLSQLKEDGLVGKKTFYGSHCPALQNSLSWVFEPNEVLGYTRSSQNEPASSNKRRNESRLMVSH